VTNGRHKTLRDAIGWSFDLCTEAERKLWARLSVFQGPFNVAAASEVCASVGLDRDDIFETIIRLVDKSLLVPVQPPRIGGNDEDQPAWYRMLDTIHEYGAEVLAAAGEENAIRARFTARYLNKARYFAKHLTDPSQLELFRELRREHSNIEAALQYTLEDSSSEQVRQGAELCNALYGYWHIAGLLREGRYWYAKVLDRLPEETSLVRGWALVNRCYLGAMPGTLTDEEWEVAYLAGAGLTHDQIARQLFISGPAVAAHLASVFGKLGVSSVDQLGPWLEAAGEPEPPAAAVPELLRGAGGPVAWVSPGFTRLARPG